MDVIVDKLASLGTYLVPVIIFVIEFIIAMLLIGKMYYLKYRKKPYRFMTENENIYRKAASKKSTELQILMKRDELLPMYVLGDCESILGITEDELCADVEKLCFIMEDMDKAQCVFEQYENWDRTDIFTREFKKRDTDTWYRLEITPGATDDTDLFVLQDITYFHKRIEDMETQMQEVREESSTVMAFMSQLSHEIRTPMNGIMGMISLTQKHFEGEKVDVNVVSTYLEKADSLAQYLLSLINDILDLSRMQAGRMELSHEPFSIAAFGDKLTNMFQKNVEAKGVRFEVIYENIEVWNLIGDEMRLSQVIVNFLSNAQKFTSEGEIVVTFKEMMQADGMIALMIRVHDTGIGMEPDFLNRIFKPFVQESTKITKSYGGSGLGMTISDQIIKLMGGEIVVESKKDVGSDFTVFLKLPEAPDQEGVAEGAGKAEASETPDTHPSGITETDFTFEGHRILMAEDNEINAMFATEVMAMRGAELEIAEDGQKAVNMFVEHEPGYYDFILMDVQMPVMDGRKATQTIRELGREDAHTIPIFALSADFFPEDIRASKLAGMNDHFAKPVDFDDIEKKIGLFLEARGFSDTAGTGGIL